MKINFVNLHAHSNHGSPLDAMGSPSEWLDAAIEKGFSAHAITDHGNMNGLSEMVQHAKKLNEEEQVIKPIYGVEAYFVDSMDEWRDTKEYCTLTKGDKSEIAVSVRKGLRRRSHLLLLAQNEVGLKNLYRLVSKSHMGDNFYYMPRMDFAMLEEHNEGIIASSACIGGVFGNFWYEYKDDNDVVDKVRVRSSMDRRNKRFKEIFGDRWYNELMWNKLPQQNLINELVIESAKKFDISLITTLDCHFIHREDWLTREYYANMKFLKQDGPIESEKEKQRIIMPKSLDDIEYEIWLKDGDEVWESYKRFGKDLFDDELIKQSLLETHSIAENRIEMFYPDNSINLPSFAVPEGRDADEYLREICFNALKEYKDCDERYEKQLEYELDVIISRGFAKYFLTMRVIIDKANEKFLGGCARGSAGGALVSYLLKITDVDPIKYDLQFSRFMTKEGTGYPDIDIDRSNSAGVKELIKEAWGPTCLAYVSNFNTLKVKNLLKDLAKLQGIDYEEVNVITKGIDYEALDGVRHERPDEHISSSYSPTYNDYMNHSKSFRFFLEEYPDIKAHLEKLIGSRRNLATHAGGAIIGDNLENQMPLIRKGTKLQTPWSEGIASRDLEPMGFIKFDILGLGTLRIFEDAIGMILKRREGMEDPQFLDIREWYDAHLSPRVLNFKDKDVFEGIFHAGKWLGIFQYGDYGVQSFCKKMQPNSVEELSVLTSIYRPGPLAAGIDKKYYKMKMGKLKPKYFTDAHQEITEPTKGFLIFQEQISKFVHELGKDISLDEGQKVRKGLTKYKDKNHPEVKKYEGQFLEGCKEKGIDNKTAIKMWDNIVEFGNYGFNKCVQENEKVSIYNREGNFIDIVEVKDVKVGNYVRSRDENTQREIFVEVLNNFDNNSAEVFEVELESGRKVKCTMQHKFRTECGKMLPLWKIIKEDLSISVCAETSLGIR